MSRNSTPRDCTRQGSAERSLLSSRKRAKQASRAAGYHHTQAAGSPQTNDSTRPGSSNCRSQTKGRTHTCLAKNTAISHTGPPASSVSRPWLPRRGMLPPLPLGAASVTAGVIGLIYTARNCDSGNPPGCMHKAPRSTAQERACTKTGGRRQSGGCAAGLLQQMLWSSLRCVSPP